MVAVVVVARSILHDGGNPNGCETKGFDVVELVYESLEVATPAWVL